MQTQSLSSLLVNRLYIAFLYFHRDIKYYYLLPNYYNIQSSPGTVVTGRRENFPPNTNKLAYGSEFVCYSSSSSLLQAALRLRRAHGCAKLALYEVSVPPLVLTIKTVL